MPRRLPATVQLDACSLCTLRPGPSQKPPHTCQAQQPLTTLSHDGGFYRVYDGLSQSRYSPQYGFLCGDANTYWVRPERRFHRDSVKKHLDWHNREPTYYISIFSSFQKALEESERRQNQPWVRDEASGRFARRGQVRVAEIAGLETLRENGVFLTSTSELRRCHVLDYSDEFVNQHEWLVLDHIPASCVVGDHSTKEFI